MIMREHEYPPTILCIPAAEHASLCAPKYFSDTLLAPGPDNNPEVRWSAGPPPGTASYAIITSDPDWPSVFTAANNEGRPIPDYVQRITFYPRSLFSG